jgi:hypothetical protein
MSRRVSDVVLPKTWRYLIAPIPSIKRARYG